MYEKKDNAFNTILLWDEKNEEGQNMTENLFTSFYGKYGNRPLKKELPRILKLINDEKIENIDLKIGLVNYVVRRAARLEIIIDYRYFEKVFLEIMAKTKKT